MAAERAGGSPRAHSAANSERVLVVDLAAKSKNWALMPEGEQRIRREAPPGWRVQVVSAETSSDGDGPPRPSDEVMAAIAAAEVYFGFGIPRLLFLAGKRLRWVHSAAAGVVTSLHDDMVASSVRLTNSAGVHAVPIAEYVVASVLHFLRGFDIAIAQQHRVEWNKAPFVSMESPLREMSSVRALILGVGGIGGATAERLAALGARCTGVRRRVSLGPPKGFERVIPLAELDDALPHHDVVVLAAPVTAETEGVFTGDRLDRLPASAIVINVARGTLVDEAALTARLVTGRLRGAALDVFHREPLASNSPLWQLRSVLLTPHISPVSPGQFWPRELDLFLDNWRRYVAGTPLTNEVDKRAGY